MTRSYIFRASGHFMSTTMTLINPLIFLWGTEFDRVKVVFSKIDKPGKKFVPLNEIMDMSAKMTPDEFLRSMDKIRKGNNIAPELAGVTKENVSGFHKAFLIRPMITPSASQGQENSRQSPLASLKAYQKRLADMASMLLPRYKSL